MTDKTLIASVAQIESKIFLIRGQKVMLDTDLAELYGVQTKVLNQAVKRNIERFPSDFTFQLTAIEKTEVVTNCDHLARLKYSSTLPYAFTEHGALMLGNVLKSDRAVEVSLMIVRTFVQLRQMLASNVRGKDVLQYNEIATPVPLTQTLSRLSVVPSSAQAGKRARGQTNRFANFTLMLSFPANLPLWKRTTTSNLKPFSMPSMN
ncbi:MAG: ORF6N domain-containing protein [Gallionella sp.]|nr:ORF6N domain-containing protein [Gallionella sp.]